jgi:hypothetical protein
LSSAWYSDITLIIASRTAHFDVARLQCDWAPTGSSGCYTCVRDKLAYGAWIYNRLPIYEVSHHGRQFHEVQNIVGEGGRWRVDHDLSQIPSELYLGIDKDEEWVQ